MIDHPNDAPITLAQAALALPRRPNGKPINTNTIYRWARAGLKGVRLETTRVGKLLFTSTAALQRFCSALANA